MTARLVDRRARIYFTAADRDFVRFYRYDPVDRSFTPLDTGLDVAKKFAVAEHAPVAVLYGSSPWEPEKLVRLDLTALDKKRLPHPASRWYRDVRHGSIEPWSFTAASGRTIEGRVYRPADFDPQRKYPAIVYYYGGTMPTDREFGGRYPKEGGPPRLLVYVIQPSGAIGTASVFGDPLNVGARPHRRRSSRARESSSRRIPTSIPSEWLHRRIHGDSLRSAPSRTDLYAAAVAHAGISSLASYWARATGATATRGGHVGSFPGTQGHLRRTEPAVPRAECGCRSC